MTAPTIGFDAIHHTYTVNGRVAPSVTGVIRSAGLMPSYEVADPSFGERVHDLTAEYDRDHPFEAPAIDMVILDETGDRLSQCLSQWIAFRRDWCFVPEKVEKRVASTTVGYAGTVDRVGRIWMFDASGASGTRRQLHAVIDIKTGEPSPWHALQTAGYVLALGMERLATKRACVYLDPDRSYYRIEWHEDPTDFSVFLATVNLHNWKARNGIA